MQRKIKEVPEQKLRRIGAQFALDIARKVVPRHYSAKNLKWKGGQIRGTTHVDADQALALMALGETLSSVKACFLRKIDFVSTGWCGDTSMGWGTSKLIQ